MQSLVSPPTFLCFVNHPDGVAQYYKRYLEHQLRESFGFAGTPIRIFFRKKLVGIDIVGDQAGENVFVLQSPDLRIQFQEKVSRRVIR